MSTRSWVIPGLRARVAPVSPGTARRGATTPRKKGIRLSPEARRRQILDIAAAILTDHGVEAVQITDVAVRANVTRPIVYRFFPTREALVLGVLEDFANALDTAYREALVRSFGEPIDVITREFVVASCDVIEAKGAGPWRLLESRGVGRAIGRAGLELHDRLFTPWFGQLAELTGVPESEIAMVISAVVSMGRAMLDFWIDGQVSRDVAIDGATRGVRALIVEFRSGLDRSRV